MCCTAWCAMGLSMDIHSHTRRESYISIRTMDDKIRVNIGDSLLASSALDLCVFVWMWYIYRHRDLIKLTFSLTSRTGKARTFTVGFWKELVSCESRTAHSSNLTGPGMREARCTPEAPLCALHNDLSFIYTLTVNMRCSSCRRVDCGLLETL